MIVLDNSVISAFCEVRRFNLLREILSMLDLQAAIPDTVEKEIIFEDPLSAITYGKTGWEKWIKILPVNVKDYEKYLRVLHDGEAGVIALAKQNNSLAALDDLNARKIANKEGIRITGTLGIVKIGYELFPVKDKTELKDIINALRAVCFRMPEDIEAEILNTEKPP